MSEETNKSNNFLIQISDDDFAACRQLLNSKPNAEYGWEFFTQTKVAGDCVIYQRYRKESGLYEYFCQGTFMDLQADRFIAMGMDLEYRIKWDHYCLSANIIEEREDMQAIYWAMKFPWPMKNRDYVYYRRYRLDSDGVFLMISRGGHYDTKPELKSFIRVENFFNIMAARQVGNETRYVLHYYEDLKSANILKSVLNWVSHTAIPQTLKQMHNVCLKFPPDLVQKQMQLIRKYQRSTISTPSSNMPAAGLLGHPNTTSSHSGPFVGFKANSSSSNSSSNSAPTPLRADVRTTSSKSIAKKISETGQTSNQPDSSSEPDAPTPKKRSKTSSTENGKETDTNSTDSGEIKKKKKKKTPSLTDSSMSNASDTSASSSGTTVKRKKISTTTTTTTIIDNGNSGNNTNTNNNGSLNDHNGNELSLPQKLQQIQQNHAHTHVERKKHNWTLYLIILIAIVFVAFFVHQYQS